MVIKFLVKLFVNYIMRSAGRWLINNNFFANLSLATSVLCLLLLFPKFIMHITWVEYHSIPELVIHTWLLYSIFKELNFNKV